MKHLKILAVLCLLLSLNSLTGCSSGQTDAGADGATVESEDGAAPVEEAPAEGGEGGEASAEAPSDDSAPADTAASDGTAPADGSAPADGQVSLDAPPPDSASLDAPPPGGDAPPPSLDTGSASAAVDGGGTPPSPEMPPADTSFSSTPSVPPVDSGSMIPEEPKIPRASAALQKIDSTPRMVDGRPLNGVYFVRPGDTLDSINEKIYGAGQDHTGELKSWNRSVFRKTEPTPGSKVYYNSPQRPDDTNLVMVYYQDHGIQPESYIAQEGDNLKTVSKRLLEYDGAWKEIWSTNPVESKGSLEVGTELKFWKGGVAVAAAAPVAPPAGSPEAAPAQPTPASDSVPPAPAAVADVPPPPPPPSSEAAAPPPPPPAQANGENPEVAADDGGGDSTTMIAGALGAIVLVLGFVIWRKKSAAKEFQVTDSFGGGDTQISA